MLQRWKKFFVLIKKDDMEMYYCFLYIIMKNNLHMYLFKYISLYLIYIYIFYDGNSFYVETDTEMGKYGNKRLNGLKYFTKFRGLF